MFVRECNMQEKWDKNIMQNKMKSELKEEKKEEKKSPKERKAIIPCEQLEQLEQLCSRSC